MPTLTFILGLCGSGKTSLRERLIAERFEEGFLLEPEKENSVKKLVSSLRSGHDAAVVEIGFCECK